MKSFDLHLWHGFISASGGISISTLIDQVVIDSRSIASKHALFVALPGRYHHGHDFVLQAAEQGASYALVGKEYRAPQNLPQDFTLLRVDSPLHAMQEIAALYRKSMDVKVLAITGSAGKTMLKDFLCALLQKQYKIIASPESFNSQIGVAMSLFQIEPQDQIAIIEAGISLQGEMDRLSAMIQPDFAILTNIMSSHVGILGDVDMVAAEKMKLLQAVNQTGWALLPLEWQNNLSCQGIAWDKDEVNLPYVTRDISSVQEAQCHYQIIFPDHAPYQSTINRNKLYCLDLIHIGIKAAALLSVPTPSIIETVGSYHFEPVGSQRWKSSQGSIIINERYCADMQSLLWAIHSLQRETGYRRKIFLFDGIRSQIALNTLEYKKIISALVIAHVDLLVLVGTEVACNISTLLPLFSASMLLESFNTLTEALSYLQRNLQKDDLLLIKGEHKLPSYAISNVLDQSICDNVLSINLAAIEGNIQKIRSRLPPQTRMMAMLKAFGYGTDSAILAHFLQGCGIDCFGLAHIDEAVELRKAGINHPLFLIHATSDEAQMVADWNLEIAVSDGLQIDTFELAAKQNNTKIRLHLHVDSGMGRFGCRPEQTLILAQKIAQSPHLIFEGVMTHLSSADMPSEDLFTQQQLHLFSDTVELLHRYQIFPRWIHASNSNGALRFDSNKSNMVRIGIGLFGLVPDSELLNAVTLTSRIVGINLMQQGESLGYGRTHRTDRMHERIAILPLGYFDGIHVQYSNKNYALICGQKAPFVGRICMDFMMVDITDIPKAEIGSSALIFGSDEYGSTIQPADFAASGGGHVHQLLTCLGPRVRRLFTYEVGL